MIREHTCTQKKKFFFSFKYGRWAKGRKEILHTHTHTHADTKLYFDFNFFFFIDWWILLWFRIELYLLNIDTDKIYSWTKKKKKKIILTYLLLCFCSTTKMHEKKKKWNNNSKFDCVSFSVSTFDPIQFAISFLADCLYYCLSSSARWCLFFPFFSYIAYE